MRYFTKEYQAMLQSSAFVPDEIVSSFIKATKEGYDKCFASDFGETPPEFWNELMLHDCEISENFWREDDFIMVLDDGDVKVAFKKAKILEQEGELDGTFWIYDELYKSKNIYEIHTMLAKYGGKRPEYIYLTLNCEDVIVEWKD